MPHAAIIDLGGLNDYVIARTKPMVERASRIMAHDRAPPEGYVDAFRPNVMLQRGRAGVVPRNRVLTVEEILAIEREWWRRADEGVLHGRRLR
jgi:arabinofuranosyltransferase